jgi:hypothetical protein
MGHPERTQTGAGPEVDEFVFSNTNQPANGDRPTGQLYLSLEDAFAHFNRDLFGAELLPVIFTLQHKGPRSPGYFAPKRFIARQSDYKLGELALNPILFLQPLPTVLQILVHQMTHAWQQGSEHAPRAGYHDKSWATKMFQLGLHPSETGEPGGRTTGQRMSQFMIPGGLFERSLQGLLDQGFEIVWAEAMNQAGLENGKGIDNDNRRVPWHCPQCDQRASAKVSALLTCGRCGIDFVRR